MITLKNVIKHFGSTKAVDNISFTVEEGEHLVLLGTSGCGKTTSLRLINRLLEYDSGNITISGKSIRDLSPEKLRQNIGYVIQHNGLFPHYTIAKNIAIVPELLKWPRQRIDQRIDELINQLQLPKELLTLYPKQLSGGQQQRVGLARALAADPPVLLMDEPFGALDNITRSAIIAEFSNFEVLRKKTMVLVTHDIKEAFTLGDTIVLMDKGKIVQSGKPAQFLFQPVNQFVKDFFASQRSQLVLSTILLKDIWSHLSTDFRKDSFLQVDDQLSLWESVNRLNSGNQHLLGIKKYGTSEMRYADYNDLFSAVETLNHVSND